MKSKFNKNFDNLLKKVISEAKKSKKQTGIVFNTTTKKHDSYPILLPIRRTSYLLSLGITVETKRSVLTILKKIDGKINYILVDSEQKNNKLSDLFSYIKKNTKKSIVLSFKSNDSTVESADVILQQLIDFSKKKTISIFGAGNIGSKLALKLVERGFDVSICRRKYSDSVNIAKSLNLLKHKTSKAKIIPKTITNISRNCDVLICFSDFQSIDEFIINKMSNNGFIMDGGIGTIKPDAISIAHKKNIQIIRLDIRAGFAGTVTTLIETKNYLENVFGTKKIKGITLVAGGFYGKNGDVVVDNIKSPHDIIGIADGTGGIKRKNFSLSDKKKLNLLKNLIKNS